MNNMVNLVEILKDAPQGLKLYSLTHGEVTLNKVDPVLKYYPIITIDKQHDITDEFSKDGKLYYDYDGAECILFPSKEHKSWDNWQEILFQRGDIVSSIQLPTPYIITDIKNNKFTYTCSDNIEHSLAPNNYRYATPEEREQFMKELNANGYKWNADTKQIEKIEQQYTPKYKVGDYIIRNSGNLHSVTKVNEIVTHIGYITHYRLFYFEGSCTGDYSLKYIESNFRLATEQELIDAGIKEKPFTIDDFKPFDKVLVQDIRSHWTCDFYIRYDNTNKLYACITSTWDKCIPYNDETKHLLGTTDDCPNKYITW